MKRTQIDKAIDAIESKIAVLQLAVAELRQQQKAKAPRKPVAVKAVNE